MSAAKISVAKKAVKYIESKISKETVLGIGTGSTVNFFIEELGNLKHHFKGVVSSSNASSEILNNKGIEVFSLNDVNEVEFYIDGADEVTPENFLIKGGGGAHTREKIVAAASNEFICIIDKTKLVSKLGAFPLPLEVIPESRSMVARKIIAMGGRPVYRNNFLTDQKNHILDIHDIDISDPVKLEKILNNIPGVVDNGIFANNKPEIVLISD
ncbi:MAG: ribose-5-phosphate isomerase RpiA [Pseudomonadota bacterium]|jgi:ribose 5-phosphate isomerase A|nr:ribose-5-phosphate isomerase RpiA [Pseudomonadota bacterium]|tara:strand:+ start:15605 stop:16243 length:639 start_codon:yes stop_codon:yes gene_type:complete